MRTIILIIFFTYSILAQGGNPIRNIFMQGNNINTVFRTDGIFNFDWVSFYPDKKAGFVWPVSSSIRMTAAYATGIWIAAKVGPQRELRAAGSWFWSYFTPGNIPVVGQVPPPSVCNDTSWKGYFVQLTDPSLVSGGTRIKTAGGRQYTFNYDSWVNWPVQKGAPYVEVNNIPGYQPGWNSDRPGIGNGSRARPEELLYMVYMDYTNCTNNIHSLETSQPGGTLPLGAELHQLSFVFNCPALKDMYFIKYKIINKSLFIWDSTFITLVNDADIGDGACGAGDDAGGCDIIRNLAFTYNSDNQDCNYGINPPAIGTRLLQSPLRYTGSSNDTARLPYDTLIGYKLIGMSSFIRFTNTPADPCLNIPNDAITAYNFMKGIDGCGRNILNPFNLNPTTFMYTGDACNRIGWFDSLSGDRRNFQSSGPFTMNSGDTQIVVLSFTITRDGGNNFQNVCALQSLSDSALKYYYNDFQTCIPIGIQPISSEVPDRFMLYQNYPNPFNPSTKIKFALPPSLKGEGKDAPMVRQGVRVIIYDILGREISTLVNEELKPGTYEVEWLAENYPSGVYFYTITFNNFFESKRMVLLK